MKQNTIDPNSPSDSIRVYRAPAKLPARFWLCILPFCAIDRVGQCSAGDLCWKLP